MCGSIEKNVVLSSKYHDKQNAPTLRRAFHGHELVFLGFFSYPVFRTKCKYSGGFSHWTCRRRQKGETLSIYANIGNEYISCGIFSLLINSIHRGSWVQRVNTMGVLCIEWCFFVLLAKIQLISFGNRFEFLVGSSDSELLKRVFLQWEMDGFPGLFLKSEKIIRKSLVLFVLL